MTLAVKGLARARQDLSGRKGAVRLFVCYPETGKLEREGGHGACVFLVGKN